MNKRFGKLMALVAACALCLGALMGCAEGEAPTDSAADNRAYMAQANTAMMQLNADLAPFSEAAAAGDVVTMEQAAAAAVRDMDAFQAIEAPEEMADIHAEYAAGCASLRSALQSYVQLYRDSPSLEDAASFDQRLAEVQQLYDEGIGHIQAGDQLVTELTGALPEEDQPQESEEAQAEA